MKDERPPATLDDVISSIDRMQNSLDEIATWLKIDGVDKVKKILVDTLDSDEKILVYHLSDGKSNKVIGEMCKVDPKTVSNCCRSWHKLGIMRAESIQNSKNKYFKIFNVEDYGIKVPNSLQPSDKNIQTKQQNEEQQNDN